MSRNIQYKLTSDDNAKKPCILDTKISSGLPFLSLTDNFVDANSITVVNITCSDINEKITDMDDVGLLHICTVKSKSNTINSLFFDSTLKQMIAFYGVHSVPYKLLPSKTLPMTVTAYGQYQETNVGATNTSTTIPFENMQNSLEDITTLVGQEIKLHTLDVSGLDIGTTIETTEFDNLVHSGSEVTILDVLEVPTSAFGLDDIPISVKGVYDVSAKSKQSIHLGRPRLDTIYIPLR